MNMGTSQELGFLNLTYSSFNLYTYNFKNVSQLNPLETSIFKESGVKV